jgi:hypothetical protein
VEQAAVDHVVEPLVPVLQRQGVFDQERGRQTSLGCLSLRPLIGSSSFGLYRLFPELRFRTIPAWGLPRVLEGKVRIHSGDDETQLLDPCSTQQGFQSN